MRKGILLGGVIVVCAAAVAATPPISGNITRSTFEDVRAQTVARSPFVRSWRVTSYDRGYLQAHATSELTVGRPGRDDTTTIVLEHEIRHAPTVGTDLAHVHTEPRIPPGGLHRLTQALYGDDRVPLTVDVAVGLTGDTRIHARSRASDGAQTVAGGTIDWRGLDLRATLGGYGQSIRYRLNAPGLRLQPGDNQPEAMRVEGVQARGEYSRSAYPDVWTGQASGSVERIAVAGDGAGGTSLHNLTFSNAIQLEDDFVAITSRVAMAKLVTPGYDLSPVRLELTGQRIAPELLQSLQRATERARQAGNRNERNRLFMSRLQQAPWGRIASRDPVLRLESLAATEANGSVAVTVRTGLHAPPGETRDIGPRALMGLAHGKITARAPEALVIEAVAAAIAMRTNAETGPARAQATDILRNLARRGMITVEKNEMRSSATYDRGAISINGQPLFGGG